MAAESSDTSTRINFDMLTEGHTIEKTINDNELSMNLIGCWNSMCLSESKGFNTEMKSQKIVADIMKQYKQSNKVDCTILLGDNHYFGDGEGLGDDSVNKSIENNIDVGLKCFEDIYGQDDSEKKHDFFALFGNHDIISEDMIKIQMSFQERLNMPRLFYNVIFTLQDSTTVNMLFIDTNMFDKNGYTSEKKNKRKIIFDTDEKKNMYKKKQNDWIHKILNESTNDIYIVCGHIPIYAYGHKTKNPIVENNELYELLLSYRNKINMYMCADEHNFQYNYDAYNDLHIFVLGSGPLGGADTAILSKEIRQKGNYMYDIGKNKLVKPYEKFRDEDSTLPKISVSDELYNACIQNQFVLSAPAFMNCKISKHGIRFGIYTIEHVLESCYGCVPLAKISYAAEDSYQINNKIALFYEKYMPKINNIVYVDDHNTYEIIDDVYTYKKPYKQIVLLHKGGNKKKYKLK
jgi:hypothetical protein